MTTTYKIVRHYFNSSAKRTVRTGALAQNGTVGYVLCVTTPEAKGPDWDRLFETAAGQSGYVTTRQAAGKRRTKLHGPWFDGYTEE